LAARANIVINDGQATPVSHTFNPTSGDGNVPGVSVISYEDRSGGIKVGFPLIQVSTRMPTRTNKNHKVTFTVKRPVLETVSNSTVSGIAPAPTVSYDVVAKIDFVLPERSTIDARKDLLAYVKNLLANATITSAVQDLESPW
jgi:hypothetical protein